MVRLPIHDDIDHKVRAFGPILGEECIERILADFATNPIPADCTSYTKTVAGIGWEMKITVDNFAYQVFGGEFVTCKVGEYLVRVETSTTDERPVKGW